jgi:hypothetical protein
MAKVSTIVTMTLLMSPSLDQQQPLRLEDRLVQASIEEGTTGAVSPYRLRAEIGQPSSQRVAIYTPYVRVALAAAQAAREQRPLHVDDLPAWVTEPVVYVVFRAPCANPPCEYEGLRLDPALPPAAVRVGPLLSTDNAAESTVDAIKVVHDLSFLNAIGGPPFENAVVMAVFRSEDLRLRTSVYARWDVSATVRAYSGGQIRQDDVRTWK